MSMARFISFSAKHAPLPTLSIVSWQWNVDNVPLAALAFQCQSDHPDHVRFTIDDEYSFHMLYGLSQ